MIRGTTPVHTFTLDYEPPDGTRFRIVYAQGEDHKEKVLFERTNENIEIDGRTITVKLTAAETLLFDSSPHFSCGKVEPYPVKIQIGTGSPDGIISWSDIIVTTVERCLRKDGAV